MIDLVNQMESIRKNVSTLGQTVSTLGQTVSTLQRRLETISNLVIPETRGILDSDKRGDSSSTPSVPDRTDTNSGYDSALRRWRLKKDGSKSNMRYVDPSCYYLIITNSLLLNRSASHGHVIRDVAKSSSTGAHLVATTYQEDAYSRSSSCLSVECNSSTEESEGGDTDELAYAKLNRKTKKLIKDLLRRVEWTLFYSGFVQCARGGQNVQTDQGNNDLHSNTGSLSSSSNNKKRSKDSRDRASDDEQDDQRNKRIKTNTTVEPSSPTGPRFACPFFKHDPQLYISCRTCAGPGWPTIHRLKYTKFFGKYFSHAD
jgi:hypothetical protein